MNRVQRAQIQRLFESFLEARARTIMNLHIEDLNINPFLIRLLEHEFGLTDARSIVQWLVHQRLERGTVTSFGIALENMAKVFSEGTGVEGADVLKTKRGRRYYIQVKSGPNTVPKDLAVRITDLLHSAQRRNRGSLALFGMCYGNPEQVSGIVHKYVGVEAISGRKFWEFISDDPNCIDEIYEIAAKVGSSFRFAHGLTLGQILQNKVTELVNEFRQRYGESGADMWRKLLELNS